MIDILALVVARGHVVHATDNCKAKGTGHAAMLSGGMRFDILLFTFEIEEVLLSIPGVRIGLAIAFDNDRDGEKVGPMWCSRRIQASPMRESVPHQNAVCQVPQVVAFGTSMPVNVTRKCQWITLKDLFAAHAKTQFRA